MSAGPLYFAYGSNLHPLRLRARVPSSRLVGRAKLRGHALRCHKKSLFDGSGKCDAYPTGREDDCVLGAVFTLDAAERPVLDGFGAPAATARSAWAMAISANVAIRVKTESLPAAALSKTEAPRLSRSGPPV